MRILVSMVTASQLQYYVVAAIALVSILTFTFIARGRGSHLPGRRRTKLMIRDFLSLEHSEDAAKDAAKLTKPSKRLGNK